MYITRVISILYIFDSWDFSFLKISNFQFVKGLKIRAVFFMKSIPLVSCQEQNINLLAIATDQFHPSFRSICRRIVSIFFFFFLITPRWIRWNSREKERERERANVRCEDCVIYLNLLPPIDSRYSDLCFHFKLHFKRLGNVFHYSRFSVKLENLESNSIFSFCLKSDSR